MQGSRKPSEGQTIQSGRPTVVMMKPRQNRYPDDLPPLLIGQWRKAQRIGTLLVTALMRPTVIEKGDILVDHPPGLALTEDHNRVQALAAN